MSTSNNRTSDKNRPSSFHGNVRDITQKTRQSGLNAREAIQRLPDILTTQQIKHLKEHKYASEGSTILDPYMQIFWKRLVEYCPLWVAPNFITIIGLIINIGTSLALIILTNGAKEQDLVYFLYQSLDAIDGKQARRTGSSSPLGELFDHGCDSVSTVFVTVAFFCALKLGDYPWLMFWCCMFSYLTFYCAHWQTYVSGKLRFGKMDCTEAQFMFISVCLISTISPNFWSLTMPIINIECRACAALMMLGSEICSSLNNIHTISQGGCGRNSSSVAGTSIIFPVWHIGFLIALAFIASNDSRSTALVEYPALFLICFGIVFSKITNQLIVAHMSKSTLNALDLAYIGPIAICINQYFQFYIGEYIFLWICLIYNLCDLLRYNTKVCQELCDALDIHCFRIKPPKTLQPDRLH